MAIGISKSTYMTFLRCPVSLWYQWHRPDIAPDTENEEEVKKSQGDQIGLLAHDYFGNGALVTADVLDKQACITETADFIDNGETVIFEATAANPADGTYAHIDVLKKVPGTDMWDMIEVKSSTRVKDYHLDDMAFQYHAFTGAGYQIRNCYLMHINNRYQRSGDFEVEKFFKLADITDKVLAKQSEIPANIKKINNVLADRTNPPDESRELLCSDPYNCDYKHAGHGWPLHSIFNIFGKREFGNIYAETGSADIDDVPDHLLPKSKKAIDAQCYRSGQEHVESAALTNFVGQLEYPLYYLDYETIMTAIPLFDGVRPYQKIPFQFSLHIQNQKNGPLMHHEFIHRDRTDPREAFVKELVKRCGTTGSIIVYNQGFESRRNTELAKEFPQYASQLQNINARMVDLYEPFKNRWLYHPNQNGSASIKAVLPAYTNLSYANMDIGNGTDAMNAFAKYVSNDPDAIDDTVLFPALLEYCKMDTYAMVVLLDVIEQKSNGKPPAPENKPVP